MSVHSVASERISMSQSIRRTVADFLAAVQFLTRIPLPALQYEADALSRAVKFFPVVGLAVGASAALLDVLLMPHLPRVVTAILIVAFLVAITGCLHEDGLADVADAFGSGWSREQILTILKDSRIGSYGGAALTLSLLARVALLGTMPAGQISRYLIAAHVLSRWTTLPLSYFLAPARSVQDGGQGARIARLTTRTTLIAGSMFTLVVCIFGLREGAAVTIAGAALIVLGSGLYYRRKIGGVTGDCFGATNQVTEIFVYLAAVWTL